MPREQTITISPPHHVRHEVLAVATTVRVLAGLAAGLAVLTTLVALRWQPLMSLDHTFARWAFHLTYGHPWLTAWWKGVGYVTEPIILRALMAVAGLLLLWRGGRALGAWLVGVALLEQLVGPYAKYLLDRPRPHWQDPIETLSTSSYPAGHATGIACFATVVVLLTLATVAHAHARRTAVAVSVVLATLVAMDRLLLGMHYLSDVAGGLMLGVATTLVCWLAMLLVSRRREG